MSDGTTIIKRPRGRPSLGLTEEEKRNRRSQLNKEYYEQHKEIVKQKYEENKEIISKNVNEKTKRIRAQLKLLINELKKRGIWSEFEELVNSV